MRVIDFVSTGLEPVIYVLRLADHANQIAWRGTRQDFIRELSAFFMFYYCPVKSFGIDEQGTVILYI